MTALADAVTAVSPKQLDFLRNSSARVNMTDGAIRAGKTVIALTRWLFFTARAPRGGELVMVGRTRDSVWRNCIGPLQDPDLFGDLANQVKGNHGAPTVTILGRRIHVLGASDAKAEKVIRGMTVAGAFVDEVTVIPEEFFTQLLGRMSVAGAKLFGSTNPDSPAHWLKTKFLDRIDELPDWRHWHFTIDDNPSLTDEYKDSIKAEFTGMWYRRFIAGEWVAAEGAIFPMWDPDTHVVDPDDLPPMQDVLAVGLDYGTQNATAALMLGLGVDGILYFLDEWTYSGRDTRRPLTDSMLADRLEAWMDGLRAQYQRPRMILVDPSAASFRTELMARGTPTTEADNSVLYGIRTMASLLGMGRLKVASTCTNLIREMPSYSWDDKAAEKGEDKPVKVADHSIDAARYCCVTTETFWSNRVRR
ncbi:PBSX family phage terminase large subunit [Galactobacter sp.]|uniref:PBSX family phage terminase large subunit n=1 Tax=Galactobacter sp. TaxID=2676125 RepID=UPI0025C3F00B|nr:PBSX family phage terminase large subunit [Galactobacter sp.]